MLMTQGRVDTPPTPPDDIAALQNEQMVYVPDDNYRHPSREAKQCDLEAFIIPLCSNFFLKFKIFEIN